MENEAKAELGRIQSQLGQAEVALGELRGAANGHQTDGRVDLTLVHLSERGALSTAFAIEGFRHEESEKLEVYARAKLEHRQFEKLAERHRAARLKKKRSESVSYSTTGRTRDLDEGSDAMKLKALFAFWLVLSWQLRRSVLPV